MEAGVHLASDPDGDICPPYGHPIPHHFGADPEADPWLQHVTPAMRDIVLAHGLRQLASLTINEKASAAIKEVEEGIVKNASARLFDEHCGTMVKPRVPPKPKVAVA